MTKQGIVKFKIDDDLIASTLIEAKTSTGGDKVNLYKKYRFFKLHKGKWLVKFAE